MKNNWYNIDNKLEILKDYVDRLNNEFDVTNNLIKAYFIVLHNFLIIERQFYSDVVLAGKEINKYLHIKKAVSIADIINTFNKYYDIYHPVRNNVETLDSIEEIRQYLSKRPEIYKVLIKK